MLHNCCKPVTKIFEGGVDRGLGGNCPLRQPRNTPAFWRMILETRYCYRNSVRLPVRHTGDPRLIRAPHDTVMFLVKG